MMYLIPPSQAHKNILNSNPKVGEQPSFIAIVPMDRLYNKAFYDQRIKEFGFKYGVAEVTMKGFQMGLPETAAGKLYKVTYFYGG